MHIVGRAFDYNNILEGKRVKLVALRLKKYAYLWWTDLHAKRAKRRKSKFKTWAKMKTKLKDRSLPAS